MNNIEPESLREMVRTAQEHWEAGREVACLEISQVLVKARPKVSRYWYMYGEGLRYVGQHVEARRALRRALRLSADMPKAVTQIAIALAASYEVDGKFGKAEAFYALALEAQPRAPGWFWILRGANYAAWGKFEAAERCHRRATRMKSADRDEAYCNLGYVLRAQRKYSEARKAFQRALKWNPDDSAAKRGLASLDGVDSAAV